MKIEEEFEIGTDKSETIGEKLYKNTAIHKEACTTGFLYSVPHKRNKKIIVQEGKSQREQCY